MVMKAVCPHTVGVLFFWPEILVFCIWWLGRMESCSGTSTWCEMPAKGKILSKGCGLQWASFCWNVKPVQTKMTSEEICLCAIGLKVSLGKPKLFLTLCLHWIPTCLLERAGFASKSDSYHCLLWLKVCWTQAEAAEKGRLAFQCPDSRDKMKCT